MTKRNSVFIASSLDGYIADKDGGIDWLHNIPNPEQTDMGYSEFMQGIDALIIGRKTFETVCSFDIDWPYTKPVFVLSHSLKKIDLEYQDKVFLVNGKLTDVLEQIHAKGYYSLYIDGGITIQNFLKEDLIDDLIITIIPILLGGGYPLFSEMDASQEFKLERSKVYLSTAVQNHYKRKIKK